MNKKKRLDYLKKLAEESAALRRSAVDRLGPKILELADLMSGVIGAGGKIMVAGNGGLATAASLFAAELIGRARPERNRQALPVVALCVDSAILTAAANDYGYENIFARQVEGLGRKGDMLFVLCADGESVNLLNAAQVARELGIIVCALLGGSGGRLATAIENSLTVPHPSPQRVQEEHIFIIHLLVEMIESDLFA
jgi:D-sedoheptulose 7-phosphate isomerase